MFENASNPYSHLDSYVTIGLRRRMVGALYDLGIKCEKTLKLMGQIPRHVFIDPVFESQAYEIKAMPIAQEQTISSPHTVAFQTEWLEVSPHHKILEIGTGSGYQCAVLCASGADVYSIEYIRELHEDACRILFKKLNLNPKLYCGDGSMGLRDEKPFDRIIVTAGAPIVPEEYVEQLNIGGILVIPVGTQEKQKMLKYRKIAEKKLEIEQSKDFKFVPLKGEKGWL